MVIGDRLRALREAKKFSQGEIETRTGLLRCYVSRVENGHTIPAVETLEKFARALEVPIYQLFYDGEEPPDLPNKGRTGKGRKDEFGSSGKDARYWVKFCRLLGKIKQRDRETLLHLVQQMTKR
jgi:transcriptional regulator with XRE-family HTH domain